LDKGDILHMSGLFGPAIVRFSRPDFSFLRALPTLAREVKEVGNGYR
jgi:hypothetical protein